MSPVIERVPFKICVTRLVGTPSCVQVRLRSYEAHAILRPGVLPDEWWLLPYPSPNDSQHSPHWMDSARFPGKRSEVSKRRDRLGDDPDCGGRTAQIRQRL